MLFEYLIVPPLLLENEEMAFIIASRFKELLNPPTQPLKIEDLKVEHESKRKNSLIAECFFKIGFIEKWGWNSKNNRILHQKRFTSLYLKLNQEV